MLLEYFGLVEQPFGVTPDPRFLHLGQGHREALASLIYGTENRRGFLALTGPPGIGKTSLLFQYLENIRNQARTAFLFQSAGDGPSLMRYLLYDLGQDPQGKDLPAMHQALNKLLEEEMHAGRPLVLVLDEAQNLSEAALEFVRLLSNFETPWMKLLHIVIAGQPQLIDLLARPGMEQLRQRISCFIRLEPFTPEETSTYIDHRLWAAGYAGDPLFTCGARVAIAHLSGGIPRNINNLCFHSMSVACATGKRQIDAKMVQEAASDAAACSSIQPLAKRVTEPQRPLDGAYHWTKKPSTRRGRLPVVDARVLTAPQSEGNSRRFSTVASISALLFLVLVFGVLWKTGGSPQPLDVTPSVQASVLPSVLRAPESPRVLAPKTTAVREEPEAAFDHPGLGAFTETAAGHGSEIAAPLRSSKVLAVTVEKGTTLRHLSLTYLHRYDLPTLARLCALNGIADPNQIEIGQNIRIPLALGRDPGSARNVATETQVAPTQEIRP